MVPPVAKPQNPRVFDLPNISRYWFDTEKAELAIGQDEKDAMERLHQDGYSRERFEVEHPIEWQEIRRFFGGLPQDQQSQALTNGGLERLKNATGERRVLSCLSKPLNHIKENVSSVFHYVSQV